MHTLGLDTLDNIYAWKQTTHRFPELCNQDLKTTHYCPRETVRTKEIIVLFRAHRFAVIQELNTDIASMIYLLRPAPSNPESSL